METTGGVSVGYVDLATGRIVAEADGYEAELEECLTRWGGRPHRARTAPPRGVDGVTPVLPPTLMIPWRPSVTLTVEDGPDDLARRAPGAAEWAKGSALLRARGEEEVAHELTRLGGDWRALHSVPVGTGSRDIDHVLIGPAGVMTLATVVRPNAAARVDTSTVIVDGRKTQAVSGARRDAADATRALSTTFGRHVAVTPMVVFVGLRELVVDSSPEDVVVTTRPRLLECLRALPAVLPPGAVELIHSHARRAGTWR